MNQQPHRIVSRTSRSRIRAGLTCVALLLALAPGVQAGDALARTEDVIYARKYGTALTMDVFKPTAGANGAGVIFVVSGGWFSAHEAINPEVMRGFVGRGYTVFAVVHGSQPKFTIPEVLEDLNRAVRYIRYNAGWYNVDPERLGITGGSAGGHLSLMIATAGAPGPADAKDPIDRTSSRVQAVGCFFPPTDFLNYGQPGRTVFTALQAELGPFKAPFDFEELDAKTKQFVRITDQARRLEIARQISPITHVSADDPPTLIIHGDADNLVPIQQSREMQERLEAVHVPVKLIVRPGAGHGWADWPKDMAIIADWFDTYLQKPATTTSPE
jgi:acetyl esterase/lipase